jgi:anaerobic selenocysteine-containing dehydrogenase
MSDTESVTTQSHGWCAMCRSRCGCISVVRDGRLIAVEPDPGHPTGAAICAKGRAVPEMVYSDARVLHPMRRTRAKDDNDAGWERISWDDALDITAGNMRRIAEETGPESVAFSITTGSGTSISDALPFLDRLMNAFGSPTNCYGTEICNWHKDEAFKFTFGAPLGSPDYEHTKCIVMWGHNPNVAWLSQASLTAKSRAAGARLIVVDPRRVGPAAKADHWLQVRPGTDGALALAMASVLLESGSVDRDHLRRWSNGAFLIRDDSNQPLNAADAGVGRAHERVVVDEQTGRLIAVDPTAPVDPQTPVPGALDTAVEIKIDGHCVTCRSAFARYRALAREMPPERAETITGVPAAQIREAAMLMWQSRPVSLYAWTGVGQHTNATQTARAISMLYALTGSFDTPGGNVRFAPVPTRDVSGRDLISADQLGKTLGLAERPLGPGTNGWVTSDDMYRAILEGSPYPVRALVAFGPNLLLSHADVERGQQALSRLEFHVHADLVMTPTARYADVFLPIASAWERRAMRAGFEMNQAANSLLQYRHPVIEPRGETRSDEWITFALAERLGLGNHFWNGDADAAYREILEPTGVSLDALRAAPRGISVPQETAYRRHEANGGFDTPSHRVEIWSEQFQDIGQDPLPDYVEPAMSPITRPDLKGQFPLVLTSAKSHAFCHSQHRNVPSLRRLQREAQVEIHPDAAEARGIANGDRVFLETPAGRITVLAKLRKDLAPDVVTAQHGWWQGCEELGLPERPPIGDESTNFNSVIGNEDQDPISGSVPHRSYLCQVSLATT